MLSPRQRNEFWDSRQRRDASVRQIYNMALNRNGSAARLLDQVGRQFPGDLLAGDPVIFLISEADAKLRTGNERLWNGRFWRPKRTFTCKRAADEALKHVTADVGLCRDGASRSEGRLLTV
jgi:hypothetical protein